MDKLFSNKVVSIGAIIIVLLVVLFACGGRGYKDTAIDFTKATLEGDAKKMVSLMSDDLVDELMKLKNESTKKTLINTMQKKLEDADEDYKSSYGKKWKYEIEYIDAVKDGDNCTVTLEVKIKGKTWLGGKKEDSHTEKIELIKDGNKWYVNKMP